MPPSCPTPKTKKEVCAATLGSRLFKSGLCSALELVARSFTVGVISDRRMYRLYVRVFDPTHPDEMHSHSTPHLAPHGHSQKSIVALSQSSSAASLPRKVKAQKFDQQFCVVSTDQQQRTALWARLQSAVTSGTGTAHVQSFQPMHVTSIHLHRQFTIKD